MITIFNTDDRPLATIPICEGSERRYNLMKEDCIVLRFSMAEPVFFGMGAYVDTKWGRFEVCDIQRPQYNTSTGGYDYELKLDAPYWKWKNKILKFDPSSTGREASWNLTAPLSDHLAIVVNMLKALGYTFGGVSYTFSIDGSIQNKAQHLTYENANILDALGMMADKWECDFWVSENVIHFGRMEFGEPVSLTQGQNAEIVRSESRGVFATRIYAFGGEKNLPSDYRPTAGDITKNGIVQKRLMLPEGTPYVDAYRYKADGSPVLIGEAEYDAATPMPQSEAVECVAVFDDIFPKMPGTMSSISTKEYFDEEEQEEGNTVKKPWKAYRFKDTDLHFSEEYVLKGEELHIIFQSGKLNGMVFAVKFNPDGEPEKLTNGQENPKAQVWEIIRNEDYGRPLPDEPLIPANGDKYILTGFDTKMVAVSMVPDAEKELLKEAQKYARKALADDGTYTATLASSWVHEDEINRTPDAGQKVRLVAPDLFQGERVSRVLGYTIKMDIPYDSPEYTIGESAAYSRMSELEDKVDALTYKGGTYQSTGGSGIYVIRTNDPTVPTNSNVFSALKSLSTFLRKDRADTASGQITFIQAPIHQRGAVFGEQFVPGLAGVGGKIDGNGNGELRSLKLNEWLEVPELRYNKVSIYTGVRWDTFGGGIIESVTPGHTGLASGTAKLKLEAGEIGAVKAGDFCMGIWHDTDGNATKDEDDRHGRFSFAGFKTVYFHITSVSGANNEQITYTLRSTADGGNNTHPFAGMHFAGRGNDSDKERQAFRYTTTDYSLSLVGVNSWEFQPSNYSEISGHIEGFTMPAIDSQGRPYLKTFHGYGQVFGNAYIFGQLDQFERQAFRCYVDQSLGGSIAPGETEQVTVQVLNGYGEDVTEKFTRISVTRNTGDEPSDTLWNSKHTDVPNPFPISFDDLGIDGIRKLAAIFHVTATDEAVSKRVQTTMDYLT